MLVKCLKCATVLGLVLSSPAAWAGTWEIVVTPVNTKTSSTSSAQAAGVAMSNSTSASLMLCAGQTTGTVTAQGQVAYSGTWTFTWKPDNSTDWPPTYKIKSIKARTYQSIISNGTGSARVLLTGGADVANAVSPATGTPSTSIPSVGTTTDNTVPYLTVVTKSMSSDAKKSMPSSGWIQTKTSTVSVERTYTATYFTSNFSAPANVVLTFTVESVDLSADFSFSGSSTSSVAAAIIGASEIYQAVL